MPQIAKASEKPSSEIEASHVIRLTDEEPNLNTKIWLNEDGTRTLELFDEPVKYVDGTGIVKDKLLSFKKVRQGYSAEQSDIEYYFDEKLENGVSMKYGDLNILMIPYFADGTARLSEDSETLAYPVTGDTVYEYSLTCAGFKENIIVYDYNGRTEFQFVYHTNGTTIKQTDNGTFITDKKGNMLASLSDIIVLTSDDVNNTFGELLVEEIQKNERYLLTIKLDPVYLADERTKYPITIDPSINIIYGETIYGNQTVDGSYIDDVTINSNAGSSGGKASVFVGNISSSGIQRLLVSFPGLDLSPIQSSEYIVSAEYRMRDLMCYSTHLPVEVHQFNSTWYESSVNWSNTFPNNYSATVLDSHTVYYRHGNYIPEGSSYSNTYAFDITDAVRNWKSSGTTAYKHQGIIFKTTGNIEGSTTYMNACFASFERANYKPRLLVTYNDPTPILLSQNIVVESGSTLSLSYYAYNATVTFVSNNVSVATVSSSGVVTGVGDGITTVVANFYRDGNIIASIPCTVFVGSERYVFFREDGRALSCNSGSIGTEYYDTGENGNNNSIRMVFLNAGSSNEYYLVPRYNKYVALTANSNNTVSFSYFTQGNTSQKWTYSTHNGGNCLESVLYGRTLVLNGNNFITSTTDFSPLGAPYVSTGPVPFVPVTQVSLSNLLFPEDQGTYYVYADMSPANATYGRNSTSWHTYTTGNSNIAYFDNGNRLNIVSEGVTTVTVTHKVTQISVTVNLTVTSLFDELHSCNKAWYIIDKSSGSDRYIQIPINTEDSYGLNSGIGVTWTTSNDKWSHQIWKLVKAEGQGCYAICATHSDNQYIVGYPGSGEVETELYDGSTYESNFISSLASYEKWKFQYSSANQKYRIVSMQDTSKCLCTNSDGTISLVGISSAPNSGYNWKINAYDNDCYHNDHYTDFSAPENVYVAVDLYATGTYKYQVLDWITATVSFNDIKSCVEAWNGISSNVSVTCVRLSDVTPDMDIIATIVRAKVMVNPMPQNPTDPPIDIYPITASTYGYTNTITGGIERVYNDVNEGIYLDCRFDAAVVYISQTGDMLSPTMIKSVITHEVGHVLKLKHEPDQYGVPLYKSSFPSIMRTIGQQSGTDYRRACINIQSYTKTIFDTSALISKWGD